MPKTYVPNAAGTQWFELTVDTDGGLLVTPASSTPVPTPTPSELDTTTAGDIVRGALRLIGARASGEAVPAAEMKDGLSALNAMVGSWNLEALMAFCLAKYVFPLTGASSYTMGVSGDWVADRPINIERAFVTLQGQSVEIPVLSDEEWLSKSQGEIGIHADRAYPLANIDVCLPNEATDITLYCKTQLRRFSNASEALVLPPGYEEALRYNLAIRLAPEWGKSATPEVVEIARNSKAAIKRANMQPVNIQCDPSFVQRGGFNIVTGEY